MNSTDTNLGHLYFLGIAGHAMSGLAIAAKHKGYVVSGVAVNAFPPSTDSLAEAGIHWHTEYNVDHLQPDMVVILANAITEDNSELQQAKRLGLTIWSFPELLEQWTAQQKRIVVAGTHGKTTTATMLAWIFEQSKQPADFIVGMSSVDFGLSARHTDAPVVILEGDEYASSVLDQQSKFSHYHPDILIVTSLEWDHPDLFPEFEMMKERFVDLLKAMPEDGLLIANSDQAEVVALAKHAPCKVVYYSSQSVSSDYMAKNILFDRTQTRFSYLAQGSDRGQMAIGLPGEHNVSNALAAIAAAEHLEVPQVSIAAGLLSFRGARRRFELISQVNQVSIIDDYAHHPSEVEATLAGARHRFPDGKLWAFFLPHTYSRTKALLPYFSTAFMQADVVIIGEIEGARESSVSASVTAADVIHQLPKGVEQLHYIMDPVQARHLIVENVSAGDTVICMSVSGADNLAGKVASGLQKRWPGT